MERVCESHKNVSICTDINQFVACEKIEVIPMEAFEEDEDILRKAFEPFRKVSKTLTALERNEPISVEEFNKLIRAQLTEPALEPEGVVISEVVRSNERVEDKVMVENIGRVYET